MDGRIDLGTEEETGKKRRGEMEDEGREYIDREEEKGGERGRGWEKERKGEIESAVAELGCIQYSCLSANSLETDGQLLSFT